MPHDSAVIKNVCVDDAGGPMHADHADPISGELWSMAEELGEIGSFDRDLRTGQGRISDNMCRIFGIDRSAMESSGDAWMGRIHPEDRGRVENALRAATADGATNVKLPVPNPARRRSPMDFDAPAARVRRARRARPPLRRQPGHDRALFHDDGQRASGRCRRILERGDQVLFARWRHHLVESRRRTPVRLHGGRSARQADRPHRARGPQVGGAQEAGDRERGRACAPRDDAAPQGRFARPCRAQRIARARRFRPRRRRLRARPRHRPAHRRAARAGALSAAGRARARHPARHSASATAPSSRPTRRRWRPMATRARNFSP